jgi:sugar phosphate isomerase/epimerase
MFRSAVTLSLVPEAKGGPFVFWEGLDPGCAQAAALGFDAVELFARSVDELNALELSRLLERHGLRLAAMGTGAGWLVHQLRLTDPDANVRAKARAFIADIIDFAGGFGAPAIIGSMQGRSGGTVERNQALAWLAEALEQLGPRAHARGVPLLIEPLNRYETNLLNTVADGLSLLNSLRTNHVRLLCDLFHMNIEEADIAASLLAAGDRVGHIHFVDTNRCAMGLGHLASEPIVSALRAIHYQGYLSAEILPSPDSVGAARQTIHAFRHWLKTGAEARSPVGP